MFSYHSFVMDALKGAIGAQSDSWVRLNAIGHHEKGVLSQEDLATLDELIEAKNAPPVVDDELDMVIDDGDEIPVVDEGVLNVVS